VFVELPKFNKEMEQVENIIQSWIYFIKNAPLFEEIPEKITSLPEIKTAFSIASRTNLTLKELEELEKREMFFEDQRGAIIKSRQEGIIEGQTALILRLLARRTGEISPEIQTRIQQLSLEQLDDLGEILLDFTSQEDLIAWLESVST
jgi:predicted transposase/invertase (TIGR01784 family)